MLEVADGLVSVVELPSGRRTATLRSENAILSADGRRIVMNDFLDNGHRLSVADAATGTLIVEKEYPIASRLSLAISPDGSSLLVLHNDNPWEIWDTDTLTRRHGLAGSDGSTHGVYDPTGRPVLFGRVDNVVTVHHVATGAVLSEMTVPIDIESVDFSATGNQIAFQYNGVVEVYEVGSPRLRALVNNVETGSFALTPDGMKLATGHSDGAIQIWDTSTGRLLEVLRGHRKEIVTLDFSMDGTFLLADVTDGTASIWELALDRRPPAEIAQLAEQVGWKLVDGALIPRR